jgi:hypothetical protein
MSLKCHDCGYPRIAPYPDYPWRMCNCQNWQTYTTMPNSSPNLPVGESRVREIVREEIAKAISAINPKEAP